MISLSLLGSSISGVTLGQISDIVYLDLLSSADHSHYDTHLRL